MIYLSPGMFNTALRRDGFIKSLCTLCICFRNKSTSSSVRYRLRAQNANNALQVQGNYHHPETHGDVQGRMPNPHVPRPSGSHSSRERSGKHSKNGEVLQMDKYRRRSVTY